jgi:hypothetical protein
MRDGSEIRKEGIFKGPVLVFVRAREGGDGRRNSSSEGVRKGEATRTAGTAKGGTISQQST